MKKMSTIYRPILFLAMALVLFSCQTSKSGDGDGEGVTFIISIDSETFSDDATLLVRLYNADQLDILNDTGNCTVSYDQQTQTEQVQCPEGVEYQEVTPEELSFPVQDIDESIEVKSDTVRVGEGFRMSISGMSSDNCNRASADINDRADSETMRYEQLVWATTMMACL